MTEFKPKPREIRAAFVEPSVRSHMTLCDLCGSAPLREEFLEKNSRGGRGARGVVV